jgi:hypothetical protein
VPLATASWAEEDTIRARLRALAAGAPALDLRVARVLAWLRTQDLASLGYSGWLSFTAEHVDWKEGWLRSLVRLVRSGLSVVLQAVCSGRLPLSIAVGAPSACPVDAQEDWIREALAGRVAGPRRRPSGASSTIEPDPVDTLAIWHARNRVRLLEGLPLGDREAGDRLLAWWWADRAPAELIAVALAPAPRPRPAPGDGGAAWSFADPADPLLGPWRTPRDVTDALQLLSQGQAARRSRAIELGQLYERVVRFGHYRAWGFQDVASFCQVTMGLSARSLQRHRELGRVLRRLPPLAQAAAAGMSLARVEAVGRVATEDDVERWVAVAQRTPVREVTQASRHVQAGADATVILDAYEEVLVTTATDTVALASIQAPVPPTQTDRTHRDLPTAARWLLAVALPAQRGFGKVKERSWYVCANPECRRRALRNHAHHRIYQMNGGDDSDANALCVCASCHLRLIHPGHVRVEAEGGTLVWRYPGRTVRVTGGPRI